MRGKKSPMIMGLIGAMLLSTNAFAAVPSDFSDFPTDWSAPAMTHAVQNGLLNGSDGKILPKGLLTRAQMATMVNRAFASSAKASLTSFTDMVPGVWHYDEMAKSVQMGAFQGADGKLSPNETPTDVTMTATIRPSPCWPVPLAWPMARRPPWTSFLTVRRSLLGPGVPWLPWWSRAM